MIYTLDEHEVDFWNDAGSLYGSHLGNVIKDVAEDLPEPFVSTPSMVSIRENQLTPVAFKGLLAVEEVDAVFAHTTTIKATQERLLMVGGVNHAQLMARVSVQMEECRTLLSAPLAQVIRVDFRRVVGQ